MPQFFVNIENSFTFVVTFNHGTYLKVHLYLFFQLGSISVFYSDTQDSARTFSALYPDLSSGSALGEFKWDNRFFYIFNIFASKNPKPK